MKKLLFISDKDKNFNESFIESVINGCLRKYFDVKCVYFGDKEDKSDDKITLLKSQRKNAFKILATQYVDFDNIDFVVVRNFLDVLKSGAKFKQKFGFKLYFQLSFPHFYRSYHEARIRGKNVLFKLIKYKINQILYANLIEKCDGFFPISLKMKQDFFPNIKTPVLPVPMGINRAQVPENHASGPIKFIYIGAVDINRDLAFFLSEFAKSKSDFEFSIYSKDLAYAGRICPKDARFRLFDAVPKDEIFAKMREFDVGCFYVPLNRLYNCSSPTKVMDYYACNLVAFTSPVVECAQLFTQDSAFFIDDAKIPEQVDQICATNRAKLRQMARAGLEILSKNRDYKQIAVQIRDFLECK